jgi:glucokinase
VSAGKLAIGIEIGATATRTGLVHRKQVVELAPPLATKEYDKPAELIEALSRGVEALKKKHTGVAAMGVGLPGMVDYEKGWLHYLPHVPGWDSIHLAGMLEEKTGLPAAVSNCCWILDPEAVIIGAAALALEMEHLSG